MAAIINSRQCWSASIQSTTAPHIHRRKESQATNVLNTEVQVTPLSLSLSPPTAPPFLSAVISLVCEHLAERLPLGWVSPQHASHKLLTL